MSATLKETKLMIIGLHNVKIFAEWKTAIITRTKTASKNGLLLKKIMLDGVSKSELTKAQQELYEEVDYQGQGILAERVDSSLAGILVEHESAHTQYTALCNLLQGLGLGTVDTIDMKMKTYKQMDAKTGIIETLEEYLKTKRNWLDQLASASGEKMSMENEIKWINLGLSSKLFASHIEQFSDESTRKATTMVKYLSRLRNVNAIRLGDDEQDMQMILDGRGFAIPLSKSKGF